MHFTTSKKGSDKGNIALILDKNNTLPEGFFSVSEADFIAKNLKNAAGDWLEINQYTRRIFVYQTPEKLAGFYLTEKMRKAGASLAKKLNKHKEKSVTVLLV